MTRWLVALVIAAGLLVPVPAATMAADPSGPVARWTFDEADGTTVVDDVGSLDGVMSGGVTRITADVPQGSGALAFDGIDDLVRIAAAPALELAGPFSVATWFRMAPPSAHSSQSVIAMGDHGCDVGSSWGIDAGHLNPQGMALLTNWPGVLPVGIGGPSDTWYDNAWHLLVYSVDPGARESVLMVDGHRAVQVWPGPDAIRYGGDDLVSADLQIGGFGMACPYRASFAGALDDIRIWDRALSREEVLAELPELPTSTELRIWADANASEGAEIDEAFADERLVLRVRVTPWPAIAGGVTLYRSDDGRPETEVGATPLRVEDMAGYAFFYQEPYSLEPGTYTFRASWAGAASWPPSTSPSWSLTIRRRTAAMSATASPDAVLPGEAITLRAVVDPPPQQSRPAGNVDFYETTGGANVLLGSGTLAYRGWPLHNEASLALPAVSPGVHTYEARYPGSAQYEPATVQVELVAGPQRSSLSLSFAPQAPTNTQPVMARLWLDGYRKGSHPTDDGLPEPTGTIVLKSAQTGSIVGSVSVVGRGEYGIEIGPLGIGSHAFVAEYSGDANYDPDSSGIGTIEVAQALVDATAGVAWSTFYPPKDGYRDALPISGTRHEPASVDIVVTSATGKVVKSFGVPIAAGDYRELWSGRRSDGSMLPTGRYVVTQTLRTEAGAVRVVQSTVTLSAKRLSVTTRTFVQDYPGGADYGGQGWAGWQFKLPSAAIYKKIVFAVDAKSNRPRGRFGPQDYTVCASSSVGPGCVTPADALPRSRSWVTLAGAPVRHIHNGKARLFIWSNGANVWVWRARVTVTYGVLK